ncbi:hypothetical protein F4777DRAFT_578565 [Nemania sp. FL0916]|nr:hypothetical protein F4777DRAFT_578565 [Nemania sp. FL0916]
MSHSHQRKTDPIASMSEVRIVGLIFYGRKEFVSILDHYLQRNLRDHGGLLDAVCFSINTDQQADLDYLEELLAVRPRYFKFSSTKETKETEETKEPQPPLSSASAGSGGAQLDWWSNSWGKFGGWVSNWGAVSEPDTIYVKIDDDVVFFNDDTIPALVKRLLENPQYFGVSANVVNGGATSWIHNRMGLFEPYWPESEPSTETDAKGKDDPSPTQAAWKPSQLPSYPGPPEGPPNFNLDGSTPAPFEGHRWLPVRHQPDQEAQKTVIPSPASTLTFNAWGPATRNWAVAAQAHSSLLHHLEQGDTWRYKFNTWNFDYERLSINFLAIRGKDVMNAFPFPADDDEEYISCTRPKELGRPVVVDGKGLVAHFAFAQQRQQNEGRSIMWTDLLSRYRAYADVYCGRE